MKTKLIASALAALALSVAGGATATQAVASPTAADAARTVAMPPLHDDVVVPGMKVKNYNFTYRISCFCAERPTVTAAVREGKVVRAWQGGKRIDINHWKVKSIQEMLREARTSQVNGGNIEVKWPKASSHPTSVFIDRIPMAVDDEVYYDILSFRRAVKAA